MARHTIEITGVTAGAGAPPCSQAAAHRHPQQVAQQQRRLPFCRIPLALLGIGHRSAPVRLDRPERLALLLAGRPCGHRQPLRLLQGLLLLLQMLGVDVADPPG